MLREKHQVYADEGDPEMQMGNFLIVEITENLREPVIPTREDGKHRTERQHVVEMCHHIIGVME